MGARRSAVFEFGSVHSFVVVVMVGFHLKLAVVAIVFFLRLHMYVFFFCIVSPHFFLLFLFVPIQDCFISLPTSIRFVCYCFFPCDV